MSFKDLVNKPLTYEALSSEISNQLREEVKKIKEEELNKKIAEEAIMKEMAKKAKISKLAKAISQSEETSDFPVFAEEPKHSDMDEKLLELMDNLDEIVQKAPPDDELTTTEAAVVSKLMDQLPSAPPKTDKEWKQALKVLEEMATVFRDHNTSGKKEASDINTPLDANTPITKLAKTCNLGEIVDYPKLKLKGAKVIGKNTLRNELILGLPNGKYSSYHVQQTILAGSFKGDVFLNDQTKLKQLSETYPYFVTIKGDASVVAANDPPTTVDAAGNQMWKVNGKYHRENGPALISADGTKQWFINGKRHRTDGPAIEYANGDKQWYINNNLHRADGPAHHRADGFQEWYNNGLLHRIDGPARIDESNNIFWIQNNLYHRTDGPAIEFANGDKQWWASGKQHRTDGPAYEFASGEKQWWSNGRQHRTDGPAIESANGDKQWWSNGKQHRMDGPAIEHVNGEKHWIQNGIRHRTDGPAIEYADGSKEWLVNGKRHRKDGPAIEWTDGYKEWWINGKQSLEAPPATSTEDNLAATTEILKSIADSLSEGFKHKIIPQPLDLEFEVNNEGDVIFSFEEEEEETSFKQTFKDDLKQAGYRIAANQISKGVKTAIVTMMQKSGSSSTRLHTISDMLNTQYGVGLISFLLGMGLQQTDLVQDERVEKIAEEFRIEGMSGVGNQVFSALMDALVPVISKTLTTLPKEEVRISMPAHTQTDTQLPVEEHFEETIPHEMVADTSG